MGQQSLNMHANTSAQYQNGSGSQCDGLSSVWSVWRQLVLKHSMWNDSWPSFARYFQQLVKHFQQKSYLLEIKLDTIVLRASPD